MKLLLFNMLCFLFISQVSGQRTINGYVQDSATGERLINAYIKVLGEDATALSNSYGYFTIKSNKDSCILLISYSGFENEAILVTGSSEMPLNIGLKQSVIFKGATVKVKKDDKLVNTTQMSSVSVSVSQIKLMPRFFGETDIIKAIQLMPGIKGGSEGTTGLYVRGGGPDQNLILLDGAPVYNASHLFGFFSIFNTDAINHVQLLKGGFPARYGGRLSSVLDITM